jgi:hypothetical protein
LFEANAAEDLAEIGSQASGSLSFLFDGIAENVAHFFFHTSSMLRGSPSQAVFDIFFQVADDQLCHVNISFYVIKISFLKKMSKRSFLVEGIRLPA